MFESAHKCEVKRVILKCDSFCFLPQALDLGNREIVRG